MIDFVTNRKVFWGDNALLEVEGTLNWYKKKNVFLSVYNKDAEAVQTIINQITAVGGTYTLFDEVKSEPDLEVIDKGVLIFNENNCDCAIALGGGSVIDATKGIAMIATNGGVAEDYQINGKEVTEIPALFIAIPTTAGTGAETTHVSVVTNHRLGVKKSFYHKSMIAEVAILDPSLTKQLPKKIMASTGIDALTHAIESYVSKNANAISRMYSLEAVKMIAQNLEKAVNENDDEARSNMLLGSYFAGYGISASIGFAHFFGMAIGGMYHVPHGDACSIFLVASMQFNMEYALADYVEIAKALGVCEYGKTPEQVAQEGIDIVARIRSSVNAPTMLTEFVKKEDIDVEDIITNVDKSTGHLKCNPRTCEPNVLREILATVM